MTADTELKIAVYGIAKNEEQFVKRWYQSAQDADYIIVGDTGCEDDTSHILYSMGANVPSLSVMPWRFDDARNTVLNLIPDWVDVCVSLDMDEVLPDNWREAIETIWTPETNIGWYDFIWSHTETGDPAVQFKQHKIHSRYGWRWKSPVHEDLVWYGEGSPNRVDLDLTIHHWPDSTKSRSSYLPLLKIAVDEDPDNHRMRHYYGRELMYRQHYSEAIEQLYICTQKTQWDVEKSVSLIYISECYLALGDLWWADAYAEWASDVIPDLREAWVQRFKVAQLVKDHTTSLRYGLNAVKCLHRYPTYMNNDYAWNGFEKDYIDSWMVD